MPPTATDTAAAVRRTAVKLRQRRVRPTTGYSPGRRTHLDGSPLADADNGQLQFHKAPHVFRIVAPGNGWGKTTVAAVEVDWWGHGDHPWQDMPRSRPRKILWVAQKYQQFEIQQSMLERWWPASVRASWNGQSKRYTWPDGSEMWVVTAETDWLTIQGIEIDLVVIDEECGVELWRELLRRRRGNSKTRYVITATATQGLTWTYRELYKPWLAHHKAKGLSERQAMREQSHRYLDDALSDTPGIWCWPMGSHADNPTATPASWALYQQMSAGSEAERQVRLYGGFRDFTGSPVFHPDQLERMRQFIRRGQVGNIAERPKTIDRRTGLADDREKYVEPAMPVLGGRIEVFRQPDPQRTYCVGIDTAMGLAHGDFDAAVAFDDLGRQAFTAHGHWGEGFADVLGPLLDWYQPFIVGERASTGLILLRKLYDQGRWVYFERNENARGRPTRDLLGHAPTKVDISIVRFRDAIAPRDNVGNLMRSKVEVYDEELLSELFRFSFRPRSSQQSVEDARDDELVWGAPRGEHDDLVRAAAYGWIAWEWLPTIPKPKPKFAARSFGAVLGYDKSEEPKDEW